MLEAARRACPESPFIHMSTNKVYGDRPNTIALRELETRWDYADPGERAARGIGEAFRGSLRTVEHHARAHRLDLSRDHVVIGALRSTTMGTPCSMASWALLMPPCVTKSRAVPSRAT